MLSFRLIQCFLYQQILIFRERNGEKKTREDGDLVCDISVANSKVRRRGEGSLIAMSGVNKTDYLVMLSNLTPLEIAKLVRSVPANAVTPTDEF